MKSFVSALITFNGLYIKHQCKVGDTVELKERMIKGIPVGRDPSIQLRNMHAAYAGTW